MAAAFFGTLASQSQAAGESISINFGTNEPNGTISDSSSAGLEAVPGSNWNQFSGASQSTAQNLKDNNGDATGATVTWSSKNTWRGGDTPSTGDGQMLKGYLDDGSGITINVSGVDFLTYGVYIYCNTDTANGNFSAKTVNGVSYTWNGTSTVAGSAAWGATGTFGQAVEGTNTLYVEGQTSPNLSITAPSNTSGSGTRGCIAGIQIVNTYEGVKISATLDGTSSSEWTSSQLGDAAWTDSADGAGTYASINVTNGPGALTIADGETRHTDAILLTGGNLTISGGTLSLSGPGILRAAEGTTLTVSSSLSGTATLDGAGTVIMNGTSTLTGLAGSGALTLGDNASISITGDTASRYTGALTLGENASLTAANPNWTFAGALTIAAANYNANDSWAHTASSLTLTGAGDVEYTFEGGTLIPITHADSTLTVRKVTDGTGTINANHASDIAHLIIDAGTVNLSGSDTAYTFESITIGQNSKLSLNGVGIVLGGTPDILMKSGSTFEMLNCRAYGADTPISANITVDAAGAGVTISGSLYGNATNLGGTITGEGELLGHQRFQRKQQLHHFLRHFRQGRLPPDEREGEQEQLRSRFLRQQHVHRRHHHRAGNAPDQLRNRTWPGFRSGAGRNAQRQQPGPGQRHYAPDGHHPEPRQRFRSQGPHRQPDGERRHQQLNGNPGQRFRRAHDFHRPGADAFRHYLSHAEQRHAEPLQLQHGSDRHAGNVHPEPDRRPDAESGQCPGA